MKLGNVPFGQGPEWLAQCYARRFRTAIIAILMADIDLSDRQVYHRLHDYFDYNELTIADPTSVEIAWSREVWPQGHRYLHEAHIPYVGTKELWRLVGNGDGRFSTRLRLGESAAHLRLLLPERNVEQFRDIVTKELALARTKAANQSGAIFWAQHHVHDRIEHLFKTDTIDPLRDEAVERIERARRQRAVILAAG